ncbi:hypothetical protein B0H13DRAFT_1852207 [Mycena leptocephala]|nr:hypothetical protein B0H13DRAFT_1852207 [Mycena leptocephala]
MTRSGPPVTATEPGFIHILKVSTHPKPPNPNPQTIFSTSDKCQRNKALEHNNSFSNVHNEGGPNGNASSNSSEVTDNNHKASNTNPLFLPSPSPSPSVIDNDYFRAITPETTTSSFPALTVDCPRYFGEVKCGPPGRLTGVQSNEPVSGASSPTSESCVVGGTGSRSAQPRLNLFTSRAISGQAHRVIRGPIQELRALIPKNNRGVKRPQVASRLRSYARPAKPQATQVNIRRTATPIMLIRWTNDLIRLEELVYHGKQGLGEVVTLLKARDVTFAWVQEPVRTRFTANGEERKDKARLVQDIVGTYAALEQEGKIANLADELFKKWLTLT